jgi:hypothetical protein
MVPCPQRDESTQLDEMLEQELAANTVGMVRDKDTTKRTTMPMKILFLFNLNIKYTFFLIKDTNFSSSKIVHFILKLFPAIILCLDLKLKNKKEKCGQFLFGHVDIQELATS